MGNYRAVRDTASVLPRKTDRSIKPGVSVSYQNGDLTINAENTTLAAVLESIAKKTGAVIDVPAGSGLERIVDHIGPAPPSDVLTQLLNGSHFNFVIVSSPEHPNVPAQVLLSMRDSEAPVASVQPSQQVPAAPTQGLSPALLDKLFSRKRPEEVSPTSDAANPASEAANPPSDGAKPPNDTAKQ